ncbi:MAG: hypothetical protein M3Y13_02350 [Armatimonadota bacterium]|nr:hypothetical protein [Armatimonadota bacterium]
MKQFHSYAMLACAMLTGAVWSLAATAAQAGSGFVLTGRTPRTVSEAAATAAITTATPGKVSADRKTITFHQKAIRLVAVTGPEKDMLSYRVDGLRNPTLIVPRNATLKMLFINADGDMFHNIRFGAWRAAYPAVADALLKNSVGTPPLPHGTETLHHAEELTLRVPSKPGKYAYFCTVRGHAPGGMWGTVLVR